ncbi:MAG: FHA domain-containing protein [Myxococcaceae bacterium]
MVPVKALREQASSMSAEQFKAHFGPVAFIQSPPEPLLQRLAMSMAGSRTVGMAHRSRLADRLLLMLRGFEGLGVSFLKPGSDGAAFTVGRVGGCALQVQDPSVSQHHATLRWDQARGGCALRDERSTNGTFVGTANIGEQEHPLMDGEAVGFGDAQFLYVLTDTLYAQLRASG